MSGADVGAVAAAGAVAVTAAALVVAVCVGVASRSAEVTVPVFLDLLLAAGLLRLGASDGWGSIAAVAALVVVRTLWWTGSRRRRGGPGRPRRHAG